MDKEVTLRGIIRVVRKRRWGMVTAHEIMFAEDMVRKLNRLEKRIEEVIKKLEERWGTGYSALLVNEILGKK